MHVSTHAGASSPVAPQQPPATAIPSGIAVASAVVVAALALSGAVPATVTAAAAVAACVAIVVATRVRTMTGFVCLVVAFRPLLDVGSGARGAGLTPTELGGLVLLAVLGVWLVRNRRAVFARLSQDRLPLALVALLLVLLLSTLGSDDPVGSVPLDLRMATGVALYLVVDLLLSRGTLTPRQLVLAATVSLVIALGYSVLGFVGFPVTHVKDGLTALKSVFHLSNNFAYFLVPFIVVSAAWTLRSRGRRQVVAIVLLGVSVIELGLTQTRGAWIAAFVGLVLLGALLERRLVLATVAAVLVAVFFVPSVHDRVATIVPSPDKVRTESSATWRLQHWDDLLPMAAASPVLGLGPDQSVEQTGKEPHNDLLRSYVEWGVAGSLAFGWLLVEMVLTALRALRRVGLLGRAGTHARVVPHDAGPATIAGLAAYIGAFLVGLVGENLIDNVTVLVVLMPALAVLRHVVEPDAGVDHAVEQPVARPVG